MFFDLRHHRWNLDNLMAVGLGVFPMQGFSATGTLLGVVVYDSLTRFDRIELTAVPLMSRLSPALALAFAFAGTVLGLGRVG